ADHRERTRLEGHCRSRRARRVRDDRARTFKRKKSQRRGGITSAYGSIGGPQRRLRRASPAKRGNECVARQRPSFLALGARREVAPGGGAQAVGGEVLQRPPSVGRRAPSHLETGER